MRDHSEILRGRGIRPTLTRLAVASKFFGNFTHPSAERVWELVKASYPGVSRATVYNTLDLFVARGLALRRGLSGGRAVYDPSTERHHHLVDERAGRVYDIPWEEVSLPTSVALRDFEVDDYHLVILGRKKKK